MRQRDIFLFWLPLFSSWVLMTAEGPLISAAINRLPDAITHLAAIGIVFGLAVAIESPIINLLATSTALVRDVASYRQVRRFTVHWIFGLTAFAAILAWSPLFDWVVSRWLGVPETISRWVRPALGVMVPWAGAIAWRRFLQGVLIGHGRTREIAWGTALRLGTSAATAIALAIGTDQPGVMVGAYALLVGVVIEALFATWAVRPVVAALPTGESPDSLSYSRLAYFHFPLAMTSVLTLLMQPFVTACLARLDQPLASLAAWPIIFQFMLLMRAVAYALPEAVIALGEDRANDRPLALFSWMLTAASLAGMALFALTPLADLYLGPLQNAPSAVAALAAYGFVLLIPLPPLSTLISWRRGVLIQRGRTWVVNEAMLVRLVVTAVLLLSGLHWQWSGIFTASAALVLSIGAELAHLSLRSAQAAPLVGTARPEGN